ncbi:MAG TPA: hypothetical protein DDW76_18450 [Cyanobacteria bacterium UBA11369]|nr:hypothetical protein [Cyanobacteria bacterium UBA11371]HBE35481.1 hypothetical protein [Cyanobacteria bacterium UBA11368]HBE50695.1 hypothetical protein [Cyanobacteria bacterium UBA11369]
MDTTKILNQIITYLVKNFKPPKIWSWQTLIIASVILGIAAIAFTAFLPILAVLSGLLLIIGVAWYTTKEPITIQGISIGSWVTGALICLLLFGIWGDPALLAIGVVAWPIVSAAVAAIPEFWHEGLKLKTPNPEVRQNLTILLLINLLLSCWLLFGFIVQGWLQAYPSIAADELGRSFFVNKVAYGSDPVPRGALVLNAVESRLRNQIDGKVWPDVERWLLNANDRVVKLSEEVTPKVEEDALWEYGADVSPIDGGYNLNLLANWRGPGTRVEGYHLRKSCKVTLSRGRGVRAGSPVSLSDLRCEPVSDPARGLLKLKSPQPTKKN